MLKSEDKTTALFLTLFVSRHTTHKTAGKRQRGIRKTKQTLKTGTT